MDQSKEILKTIIESSNIISVLLVFVIVVFDIKNKVIQEDLKKVKPFNNRPKEVRSFNKYLLKSLVINVLPLMVIFFVLSILFLPLFVKICQNFRFDLMDQIFAVSLFFIVSLFIFAFLIISIVFFINYLIRILRKYE